MLFVRTWVAWGKLAHPHGSMDLRARVVAAVEGGLSRNEAARRFDVAISTAINWVRRKAETGSVAPGQMGGHKPRSIRGEHEAWLLERIKQGNYTLRGLVTELGARGLKVDYRSVWTFVHEQDQSFKRNRAGQRTGSSRCRAKTRAMA
jgi:transposase